MANTLKTPKVMPSEFCADGDKNTILTSPSTSNPQLANFSTGFPAITQTPIPNGGIPPERADFNGMFNLLSSALVYIQNGGQWTFVPEVSNAIGGYPAGAILNYYDATNKVNKRVISNINNNVNNFLLDPSQIGDSSKPWSYTENTPIVQDLTNPSADTVPSTKAVSDESSRIVSIVGTKVNKSGDTMTGNLSFKPNNGIVGKMNQAYNATPTPSDIGFLGFMYDVNGVQWAQLKFQIEKDSNSQMFMLKDKTGKWRGNCGVYATTSQTYMKSGYSKNIDSVITTKYLNTNCVRFGNGLQICWGNSAVNQTITFQQPFKNTSYSVTFCQTVNAEHNINNTAVDKTATSFKFNRGYTGDWIAIGYWY